MTAYQPAGHAFILRRFDTGAISLSTMFRASYPTANEQAEKEETSWVKSNFDNQGSNGGGKLRLAGTWVPPQIALFLAESYGLGNVLPALANAVPENRAAYRKNNKSGVNSSPTSSSVANAGNAVNGAASLIPTSLPPTTTTPKGTPNKRDAVSPSRQPPPKKSRKSVSPAPSLLKPLTQATRSSPRRPAKIQEEEDEPEVPGPDPDQDIAEAKEEYEKLKAEHLAAQAHKEAAASTPAKTKKRNIEDTGTPPFSLDMDRIAALAEDTVMDLIPSRPIINRRRLANLPPTQKAAAWGGLAFFIGLGAT